jgi:hypothetical protein
MGTDPLHHIFLTNHGAVLVICCKLEGRIGALELKEAAKQQRISERGA